MSNHSSFLCQCWANPQTSARLKHGCQRTRSPLACRLPAWRAPESIFHWSYTRMPQCTFCHILAHLWPLSPADTAPGTSGDAGQYPGSAEAGGQPLDRDLGGDNFDRSDGPGGKALFPAKEPHAGLGREMSSRLYCAAVPLWQASTCSLDRTC
jgi:hypothetical protein